MVQVTFTFTSADHAWCKIVGIHNYIDNPGAHMSIGTPVTLVQSSEELDAVEVRLASNDTMIGHLRYQVAPIIHEILTEGWTISASADSDYNVFTDGEGRKFTECNLNMTISGDTNTNDFDGAAFLLDDLVQRSMDYPYDGF